MPGPTTAHPTDLVASTAAGATGPARAVTSSGGTQAVDRAAQLVAAVLHADEPLSFADLLESSGLAKSTASRMLAALERAGLLERDATGAYIAGELFWLYAARRDPGHDLARLARPTMEQISEDTRETVHLSVVRGDRVVQVAQVDSRFMLGTRDWTDVDVPAHCSSLGKVFYAFGALALPTTHLEQPTSSSLGTVEDLLADGERTRRQGFAATSDELEVGLTGIAVPVYRGRGELIAALGISGPTPRLQGRHDDIGRHLLQYATQLSTLLRGQTRKEGAA